MSSPVSLVPDTHRDPGALNGLLGEVATAGDTEAFAEVVRLTSSWTTRLAWQLIRDHAQTEEAVQEAYLEVWCTAHRFDPGRGDAGSWISAVVRHRAIDKIRSSESDALRVERYGASMHDAEHDSTAEEADAHLTGAVLRRSVSKLHPAEQQVIELAFWSGMSHSQVAQLLGLPLGTVKTRLRRAMGHLRRALRDHDPRADETTAPSGSSAPQLR